MKTYKTHILIIAFILFVISGAILDNYLSNQANQKENKNLEIIQENLELNKKLEETEKQLKEVSNKPPEVIYKTNTITTTVDSPKELTTAEIVKEFSPQVVYIFCSWYYSDQTLMASGSGSGFLSTFSDGDLAVLTNKHVFLYGPNQYTPKTCTVYFLNGEQYTVYWGSKNFSYSPYYDIGQINFDYISNATRALIKRTKGTGYYCNREPDIGDKIVALGYPTIGSSKGITATEGIIAGLEGDYYIISAKLDHGNSGGIAVSVKGNCIIGMTTSAVEGTVESLGRIISAKTILK